MSVKKINRIGERSFSNQGYEMLIIEYHNNKNVIIEFQDEYKAKARCSYIHFKNGQVNNPYHKSVYGVGFIGDGKYSNKTHPKIYAEWIDLIRRCFDKDFKNKYTTYKDCILEDYLLCFQNFAKWYEENYYEVEGEIMALDKDILFKGNKIYSRDTIMFVPQRINTLFVKSNAIRGEYPIGVTYSKNEDKLKVSCKVNGKTVGLGTFKPNQVEEAFQCYKQFKENYIKQVADEYKPYIPKKLYDAMYRYEVEITD